MALSGPDCGTHFPETSGEREMPHTVSIPKLITRAGRMARFALRRRFRSFRRDTFGGVAAIVAITSPVLIGAMGLGGEAGYWYLTQRKVQNAADVAAHAAALREMGCQIAQGYHYARPLDLSALAPFVAARVTAERKSG